MGSLCPRVQSMGPSVLGLGWVCCVAMVGTDGLTPRSEWEGRGQCLTVSFEVNDLITSQRSTALPGAPLLGKAFNTRALGVASALDLLGLTPLLSDRNRGQSALQSPILAPELNSLKLVKVNPLFPHLRGPIVLASSSLCRAVLLDSTRTAYMHHCPGICIALLLKTRGIAPIPFTCGMQGPTSPCWHVGLHYSQPLWTLP